MRIKFNNPFMSLHTKSMGKLFEVVSLEDRKTYESKGLIQVSKIGSRPAIAGQYSGTIDSHKLKSEHLNYIKVDSLYYAILFISNVVNDVNAFLGNNEQCSLLASDNYGYHYITSDIGESLEKNG